MAEQPPSYRQVSERLGVPIGSIGPTQARCLRRLRDCAVLAPYLGLRPDTGRQGGDRDGAVAAGR
jgi:hypothetical protein